MNTAPSNPDDKPAGIYYMEPEDTCYDHGARSMDCAPLLTTAITAPATPAIPAAFTEHLPRPVHVAYAVLLVVLVALVLAQAGIEWFLALALLALVPYCLDPQAPSVCCVASIAAVAVVCFFAVLNLGSLEIVFSRHANASHGNSTASAVRLLDPLVH